MKYLKSKSLNGDNIVWIARAKGRKGVVARAASEEELDLLLSRGKENKVDSKLEKKSFKKKRFSSKK